MNRDLRALFVRGHRARRGKLPGASCTLLSLCAILCAVAIAFAQEPAPAEPPAQAPAAPAGGPRGGANNGEPQPYDRVITKDAKTRKGVFTIHQVKERYYYEIPKSELGKEFLWNTQIARTTLGAGFGGQQIADRVVRWELNGNRIFLRDIKYDLVADAKLPISLAVNAANNDTIVMAFPVATFAKDGDPVIEVTRLFTTDVTEISARQRLGATGMDANRSYIERISPFPQNIETEATLTYTRNAAPAGAGGGGNPGGGNNNQMRPGSASVVIHHSMVKLPEKPMMPRVFDERVGFFADAKMDFSKDEPRAPRVKYIDRWRLEKKDPTAALSEPVKPIVYYIDAATPAKWVPWLKKGIESWQKAFEAAGFKNAIIAKEAPTAEQDPDFSAEDARYAVIRWLPSTTENAFGPNIHDPRTGEILDADIQLHQNVLNLARDWYFLQVGPLDPRAQKLPMPDELMGRLLQFVAAHEVGHTLGLEHNMKASSMYPADKVHDRDWVKKMGFAPSIMDYARFDYVAQPEDKIDVEDLVPGIGPYDIWAIGWGYRPIQGVQTPDQEKPTLDQWAREQDKTPWYRFSTARSGGADPGELTEAVGDADAIQSTALGLKNLQRVAKLLLPAATTKQGESYDDVAELYGRMLGQWTIEMNHVAAIVGGFDTQEKYVGQNGTIFVPLPKAHQEAAVRFLNDNAFAPPMWAVDPEILRRIEPVGVLGRVRNAQNSVLNSLLSSSRFARLVEQEAIDGRTAYSPADFLAQVRKGVWKELDAPQVKIDAYRRNLQRAYLDVVNNKLNAPPAAPPRGADPAAAATSGDEAPFYRAELRNLSATISSAVVKASDRETRAHLEGMKDQIARILDPRFAPASNNAAIAANRNGEDSDPFSISQDPQNCWPDYMILP